MPYLDALGVGAVYASPLLDSGAGSNHGYDVVDPTRICGGARGRGGAARPRRGGARTRPGLPARHRAEPRRRRRRAGRTRGGGTCSRHGRARGTRRTSTSTGTRARSCCRSWAPSPTRTTRRRCLVRASRSPTTAPSCATTSTPSPSRRARGRCGGSGVQEVHERQHYRLDLVEARRGGADLPALLRRLDAGGRARRGPGGVRGHPRRGAALGGGGRGRRAARGPPGRPVRPRRLRAAAARGDRARPLAAGGEDPRRRRGAARRRGRSTARPGYEALREICGVFVDPDGAGLLTQLTAEHVGRKENAHAAEYVARREVADTILAAEVRRIAALVPVPTPLRRPTRTGPCGRPREAVAELLCGFPVYRSYLPEGRSGARDRRVGGARAPAGPRGRARPRSATRCSPTRAASWPPGCSRRRAW